MFHNREGAFDFKRTEMNSDGIRYSVIDNSVSIYWENLLEFCQLKCHLELGAILYAYNVITYFGGVYADVWLRRETQQARTDFLEGP